jgi:hypothetical protein
MRALDKFASWENDVETVASRSSTESESDEFLNQKAPFLSIQDMDQLNDLDNGDCPFCRRKPFWKRQFSSRLWKGDSTGCKHDRRSIREYNQTTSPIQRRQRTRRCTIVFGILTLLFALLYVNYPELCLNFTNMYFTSAACTMLSQFLLALGHCYGIQTSTNSFSIGENQDSQAKECQDIPQISHVTYYQYPVIPITTIGDKYRSSLLSTTAAQVWKQMSGSSVKSS